MSNKLENKLGIYVELDALLDTRLSTIHGLGEGKSLHVLKNGYFKRQTDVFDGIDKLEFDTAYQARDKTVLINAVVTNVIIYIKQLVIAATQQAITTPFTTGPKIYLNTWPYILTDEESDNILKALVVSTNKSADVQLINVSREDMTPEYCKKNFSVMFMYTYGPWLDIQSKNFEKDRCVSTTLLAPGIYFDRAPTEDELYNLLQKGMHPLRQVELMSSFFIDLKFQDVELFCACIPNKPA